MIHDVSRPDAVVYQGFLDTEASVEGVAVWDGLLYVMDGSTLQMWPAQCEPVAATPTPVSAAR